MHVEENENIYDYFNNIRNGTIKETITLDELLNKEVCPDLKGPLKYVLLEGLEKTEILEKPCLVKTVAINPVHHFEENGVIIVDYIMFGCVRGFIEQMRYDKVILDLNDPEHSEVMALLNNVVFNTVKAIYKTKVFSSNFMEHIESNSSTVFTVLKEDSFDPIAPVYFMCRISEESRLN